MLINLKWTCSQYKNKGKVRLLHDKAIVYRYATMSKLHSHGWHTRPPEKSELRPECCTRPWAIATWRTQRPLASVSNSCQLMKHIRQHSPHYKRVQLWVCWLTNIIYHKQNNTLFQLKTRNTHLFLAWQVLLGAGRYSPILEKCPTSHLKCSYKYPYYCLPPENELSQFCPPPSCKIFWKNHCLVNLNYMKPSK